MDKKFRGKLPEKENMILNTTKPYGKAQMVMLKQNSMAMARLLNSFTNKELLNKIHDSKCDD